MKLNPIQRLAYKLGIPRGLLNVFAQEYYGYPIPNAEGKYPDWWYEEQGVPTNFRDVEVPREVLAREKVGGGIRRSGTPKVYVKVKHGKIVEIVANQTLESAPAISQHRREMPNPYADFPQHVVTEDMYFQPHGAMPRAVDDMAAEEYMARVPERRYNTVPALHRSVSAPAPRPGTASDIMSLIHEDRMPPPRATRPVPVTAAPARPTNIPPASSQPPPRAVPKRASTLPTRPMAPAQYTPHVPLSNNPAPTQHHRTPTTLTDDTILRYYRHSTLSQAAPPATYRNSQQAAFTPLQRVPEDGMTVWSGYTVEEEEEDLEWEDVSDVGSRSSYRRLAQEGLREYRKE
jgi:hypothetical protein